MFINLLFLSALALFLYLLTVRVNPNTTAFKLMERLLLGAATVFIFNLLAGFFGMRIGQNPFTALVAGLLGVPGLGLLIVLRLMI